MSDIYMIGNKFSNEDEVEEYKERYCNHCLNRKWVGDCAVWQAHLIYNNGAVRATDLLIPITKDGMPGECRMFLHWTY